MTAGTRRRAVAANPALTRLWQAVRMESVPPADENSPLIRYGFAAIFVAACLYRLEWGVRVAGAFLLGMGMYEILLGRVPLTGWTWKTTGTLTGPAAMVLSAVVMAAGAFLLFAPDLAIGLLATLSAAD
jgi:hypothetical protein